MILAHYEHIETPPHIRQILHHIMQQKSVDVRQTDFTTYQTAPEHAFLLDSLRYRHEIGRPSSTIPFRTYYPTFQSLDPFRRNFYFYWRQEAVQGHFLPADLSYIFLFVYELINYGYSEDARFNISMMERLYQAYHYRYPKLDGYLRKWMADFLTEVGEPTLAASWSETPSEEPSAYADLKRSEHQLHTIHMSHWRKYMPLCEETSFFQQHKPKIYQTFKEAVIGLQAFYQQENEEGIFERLFPLQQQTQLRSLYEGCLIDRPVSLVSITSYTRVYDPSYGQFLRDVLRFCEHFVRIHLQENTPLSISTKQLPDTITTYLTTHLSRKKRSSSATKTKDDIHAVIEVVPPPVVALDFSRIGTLTEESEAFLQLYATKYQEETEIQPVEAPIESPPVQQPSSLFSSIETDIDITTLIASLSAVEKEFLLLYRNQQVTVPHAKAWLKANGWLLGSFLVSLNEKASTHLGDILLEEEDDGLVITEEWVSIVDLL